MKLNHKSLFIATALMATAATSLTSCLEETFPESSTATAPQVSGNIGGLSGGVSAYMTTFTTDYYYDVGFMTNLVVRDAMTADFPVYSTGYDYFSYWASQNYLGNWAWQQLIWYRYYYLIQKANSVLSVSDSEYTDREYDCADAAYIGDALGYRIFAYSEMSDIYEYFPTGVAALDANAESKGLWGLTVPIVTEKTAEHEARQNPRVPFYTMYRFINADILDAIGYLKHQELSQDNKVHLSTVYGLAARLWLKIATRFERFPEDLATQLEHDSDADIPYATLGVSSATEAYAKAAEYARLAINRGNTPLSQSQWYDPKTGFNSPNNSWMWCITITSSDNLTNQTWQSFQSYCSMEPSYGVGSFYPTEDSDGYKAGRMIDASLFQSISTSDWRRATWIDPHDVGSKEAYTSTYQAGTNLTYEQWKYTPGYVGNKFHPGGGNISQSKVGNAFSLPLMRVEEMYFIEAEAAAHSQGLGAGISLLENFMNTYRYTDGSYKVAAGSLADFTTELIRQKRIEFWGEGIVLWDFRRLGLPIIKAYEGTNHPKEYQFNSLEGYVAPWSTLFIPTNEVQMNTAIKSNPDPSNAIPVGTQYEPSYTY